MPADLLALAAAYQRALPDRIRRYLNGRGIPDAVIDLHQLGWDGSRIAIPIFNHAGVLAFFKLVKDPDDPTPGPKMLTSPGGTLELYGWERVASKPCRLVICEGEFDRLVLEAHGLPAVTSTGGAGALRREWATEIAPIPEVYLCFDRDDAGRRGALRVGQFLPQAKIVTLPEEVGPGGDVTDFFVLLDRTREDFEELLKTAAPVPAPPETLPVATRHAPPPTLTALRQRVDALKAAVLIADVAARYVALRPSGPNFRGRCSFHEDHDPSLMVFPQSATFHCFGCGRHGDMIAFVIAIEGLTFWRALEFLGDLPRDHAGREAA